MAVRQRYERLRDRLARRPLTVVGSVAGAVLVADLLRRLVVGSLSLSQLMTFTWDGIVVGLAISLAGVGLSMTYSILSFANFSHGDYLTAGAFAGWAVTFLVAGFDTGDFGYLFLVGVGTGPSPAELGITVGGTPVAVLVGLGVAVLATIAVALAIDRLVYEPMRDQGGITLLIASIGVALALRYLIVFVFAASPRGLTAGPGRKAVFGFVDGRFAVAESGPVFDRALAGQPPDGFYLALPPDIGTYSARLINLTSHEATLVGVSLVLMVGIHILLQRTKLGKAMRAMADNKSLARVTGIPTERVVTATWVIGGGLAGAGGYLIALERGTLSTELGWALLLLIFAAVILGGIGSIYGAMAGGVIIGVTSKVSLVWLPSGFATAAAFGVMILVLLFRPEGIFGGVTTA